MRVYVVESLKDEDSARRVMDVYQSSEMARDQHRASDWTVNAFDEWECASLQRRMRPHETKG